jgi:hypothetical protein
LAEGPLFVYGNWASYDELSDSVPLDEALAMRQLGHLLRLRRSGVRFDAYLMDAFWFGRDGAYRTWRKPHWPDGPDRWLDACGEHGLLPGLWFTANTLFHLDLPHAWADSIDEKGWGLCLFKGGFLSDFLAVLAHWYERGVRVFKFDFAEFGAFPAGDEMDSETARRENVAAFRSEFKAFRRAHPEAVLLGYNGFEDRECMDRSDRPPGRYVDPGWLDVLDSLYCGDPRPSDLPLPEFWRSVDVYTDCLARLFESSGIPLHRIDNCGFMAGDTGTCYWRGKAGWKAMLALSLARGGRIHVAYGDLGLFDDEDARWWASAQRLYAPGMVEGATKSFGGWPGSGEPYGWLSASETRAVATVVNPSMRRGALGLPPGPLASSVTLEPGEVRILVAGKDAASIDLGDRLPALGTRIMEEQGTGPLSLELPRLESPARLRVCVTQARGDGTASRVFPAGDDQAPFRIRIREGDAWRELPPMFDRKIWSGLSWWVAEFGCEPGPNARFLEVSSLATEETTLNVGIERI